MSEFWEAYRDPRWQEKRLKIMERAEFKCERCSREDNATLNVHHSYYESGKKPWEYPDESLRCWCEDCHANFHEFSKYLREIVGQLSFYEPGKGSGSVRRGEPLFGVLEDQIIGYVRGLVSRFSGKGKILIENVEVAIGVNASVEHWGRSWDVYDLRKKYGDKVPLWAIQQVTEKIQNQCNYLWKAIQWFRAGVKYHCSAFGFVGSVYASKAKGDDDDDVEGS